MKKILISFPLLAASYFLMRWFNHTDQGLSGRQLGLDGPSDQMATGLPFAAGWLSIFAFIAAVILFFAGIRQLKQDRELANEPVKPNGRLARVFRQMDRRKVIRQLEKKA